MSSYSRIIGWTERQLWVPLCLPFSQDNSKAIVTKVIKIASAFAVDPVKIFLASSLITFENLFAVSHTVRACRESQKLGVCDPYFWDWGRGWPPGHMLFTTCVLPCQISFILRHTVYTSVITEIRQKLTLELTRFDRQPMNYDFLQ